MPGQTFRIHRSSRAKQLKTAGFNSNGPRVMISCYHLRRFHHANGHHFCHRFLWHICRAGAAKVLALACADFQGWERVRCRLNFTVKIFKIQSLCFYLFASFTSVPLHFLVLVSLVQSNPSRLSSCKRLLINLVAHDFIMKLMVLLIRGAVSFILIDIIVYRKMRNHFLLSLVSSNASYMIIHCFMGLHMSFHATLHYSILTWLIDL